MTTKILQHNGKVVCRSTKWPLIIEETVDPQVQYNMHSFNETIKAPLGAMLVHKNF